LTKETKRENYKKVSKSKHGNFYTKVRKIKPRYNILSKTLLHIEPFDINCWIQGFTNL